jgi:hypothetical protein
VSNAEATSRRGGVALRILAAVAAMAGLWVAAFCEQVSPRIDHWLDKSNSL